MTAQKIYTILRFIDETDSKLGVQTKLESVSAALVNLVSQPAQPTHQAALASALAEFIAATSNLVASITPSQATNIAELGGQEFFDASMAQKVREVIEKNAMTPAVARDLVQELANHRSGFLSVVRATAKGLQQLKIGETGLAPGSADLAFLIPRDLFDNQLGTFAKELSFINRLIRNFSEAITGQAEAVELEELSSSIPTVALAASGAVLLAIANTVTKFLDAWKKIEEIREIRGRLTKMGLRGALEELTTQITTTVDEVIQESTEIVIANYKEGDGRKNELSNALSQDMRRLFGQIERGLTVEFRSEASEDDVNEENKKALQALSALSRQIQFPQIASEPMLLKSAEVVEGPIEGVEIIKKTVTTTHKSTKKETAKGVKPETKEGV